jgi:histidinol-phosphate phosphatase family protein
MKLVILDRDGTINHDSEQYIKSPAEWRPIEGSLEAIARLTQAGYRIVVATNQSGIARGLLDTTTLVAIHDRLQRAAAQVGGRIDAFSSARTQPIRRASAASRARACCSRSRAASTSRSRTCTW